MAVDNKLHSREDISRHCEGFQRETPPHTHTHTAHQAQSGLRPLLLQPPWYPDGATAAVSNLNV